jgi:serine/threonine protein phosphatase 1
MRCYVIGDIHGCLEELQRLLESLPLDARDRVVFLGDYIDRGPNANGVIDYLLRLEGEREPSFTFLKGNHEDMLLAYLGLPGRYGDMFLFNGGGATLASYGVRHGAPPAAARQAIPERHLSFLLRLKRYEIVDSYLCVHAGINPAKPLTEQSEEELFWIRDEFILKPHPLPYTVLFGHTPQREVLYHLPYKIGLDTGLVYGNRLSCLELSEKVLFQIARGAKRVFRTSVGERWERATRVPPA